MDQIDWDAILGTTRELLKAEEMSDAARLLCENDNPMIKQTGCGGWNDNRTLTIYFATPAVNYKLLKSRLEKIEQQITENLNIALEQYTEDVYSARIVPQTIQEKNWRTEISEISTEVRRIIISTLCDRNDILWCGVLNDLDFLDGLYDLKRLPSCDSRYPNAHDDIWQHCICHNDWDENWIFTDNRFGLLDGASDTFLRFLCRTIHPEVRPDREQAAKLAACYNEKLRPEGWEIIEGEPISNSPNFIYRKLNSQEKLMAHARTAFESLDADHISKKIEKMEQIIDSDPRAAIGEAKELVESCCKIILIKMGSEEHELKKYDMPKLSNLLSEKLKLLPKNIPDDKKGAEIIKTILRNIGNIPSSLANLRNEYGSGHGPGIKYKALQPRHAKLAVVSAICFVGFVMDTYCYQQQVAIKETNTSTCP